MMSLAKRWLWLLMLVGLLQACATQRVPPRTPQPSPQPPPAPVYIPDTRTMPMEIPRPAAPAPLPESSIPPSATDIPSQGQTHSPVVLALLADVDVLEQQGAYDQAAARVERGLRISPKDASLWQRLAILRLRQQRYEQAVVMAKKSSSLAQGDPALLGSNWQLIAEARYRMGDTAGANRARAKAARYQRP
ncbi:MAG: tetratricopeptide repeat protein [bacterium]